MRVCMNIGVKDIVELGVRQRRCDHFLWERPRGLGLFRGECEKHEPEEHGDVMRVLEVRAPCGETRTRGS